LLKLSHGQVEHYGSDNAAPLPKTNFAQAALLLQQSSLVYSRKVEYLLSLVYKARQEISANERDKTKRKTAPASSAVMNEVELHDPHQQFLLLDNVVPVDAAERNRQSISLPVDPPELSRFCLDQSPRHSSLTRSDMTSTLALNQSATMSGYKQMSHQPLYQLLEGIYPTEEDDECENDDPVTQETDRLSSPLRYGNDMDDHSYGDKNDDYGGGGGDGDGDLDGGYAMNMSIDHDDNIQALHSGQPDQRTAPLLDTTKENQPSQLAKRLPTTKPKVKDPWTMLEPHDNLGFDKPLEIGCTIRLPPGLKYLPSECVTGARTTRRMAPRVKAPTQPILPPWLHKLESVPLDDLVLGNEFRYMKKHFATIKRKKREQEAAQASEADRRAGGLGGDIQGDLNNVGDDGYDSDNDTGDYGGWGFGGDNDDNSVGTRMLNNTGGDSGANGGEGHDFTGKSNSQVCLSQSVMSLTLCVKEENHAATSAASYQEACKVRSRQLYDDSEWQYRETDLAKRVRVWQERLEPILEEEEKRPPFDITAYRRTIVDTLSSATEPNCFMPTQVDFAEVARGKPVYEVCRLFLATLSLVNSHNVTIGDSNPQGTELTLELLHDEMDTTMEMHLDLDT
jgi:condensin-2 complex subunit H2